ncbi:oxidoreductase [Photobacterium sp. ZSDE20]|uniref:Oxidoreductase n=1 Tax=Photobacterium pectinilyticum TaxID=2906793 RepID=A0ABT1NAC8_9GAMM|nr:oxidoreductase [Photobacterium sp. ZSDE20]MCQ1060264.1 oxidoreductase [Photobacterium sp. ZSDE20]MDD1827466.1 oxidoreductase [Photobacterium sp. ZSDE20]
MLKTRSKLMMFSLLNSLVIFTTFSAWSQSIPLAITGKNPSGEMLTLDLTRDQLEQLPQTTLSTNLPWLEQSATFEGVRLLTLIKHFDLPTSKLKLIALNDYSVVINHDYITQYNPLLAIKKDGRYLKVRDYGPYWVIISLNEHPEAAETKHLGNMVWQLTVIEAHE